MTWNYLPNYSLARDRIRLLIGDIDSSDQWISDEAIAVAVAAFPDDDNLAAARCCDFIIAMLSRKSNVSTGGISVDWDARIDNYRLLAASLRDRKNDDAISAGCTIHVGGSTIDDIEALDTDDALQQPSFKNKQFDNSTNDPGGNTDEE